MSISIILLSLLRESNVWGGFGWHSDKWPLSICSIELQSIWLFIHHSESSLTAKSSCRGQTSTSLALISWRKCHDSYPRSLCSLPLFLTRFQEGNYFSGITDACRLRAVVPLSCVLRSRLIPGVWMNSYRAVDDHINKTSEPFNRSLLKEEILSHHWPLDQHTARISL